MTRARWLIVVVVLAAAQLVLFAFGSRMEERRRVAAFPVRVEHRSDPAHDFDAEGFGGTVRRLQARSGRFQLIHFWATWCPPCRTELPALLRLAERQRDRIQVWAVSTDRDWSSVEEFMGGPIPAAIVRDAGGEAARRYGVTALPDSYLIGPDGMIRARFSGAQNWSAGEMERILESILRNS